MSTTHLPRRRAHLRVIPAPPAHAGGATRQVVDFGEPLMREYRTYGQLSARYAIAVSLIERAVRENMLSAYTFNGASGRLFVRLDEFLALFQPDEPRRSA